MNRMATNFVLGLLRGYKWVLSPLLPPACRYVPTCSDYTLEAVDRYGILRGGLMAIWRVLRCHPFVQGGFDPVVKVPAAKCAARFKNYGVTASAPSASRAVTE